MTTAHRVHTRAPLVIARQRHDSGRRTATRADRHSCLLLLPSSRLEPCSTRRLCPSLAPSRGSGPGNASARSTAHSLSSLRCEAARSVHVPVSPSRISESHRRRLLSAIWRPSIWQRGSPSVILVFGVGGVEEGISRTFSALGRHHGARARQRRRGLPDTLSCRAGLGERRPSGGNGSLAWVRLGSSAPRRSRRSLSITTREGKTPSPATATLLLNVGGNGGACR